MDETREIERLAALTFRLAGDRRGDETPVHLRQDDVHRQIGGGEPARVCTPLRLARPGEDRLQHDRVGRVENAGRRLAATRERRRVDDDVRPFRGDRIAQDGRGLRVLQAGGVERGDLDAARGERVGERDDRRTIAGEHIRAIKRDEGVAARVRHGAAGGDVTPGRWQRTRRHRRRGTPEPRLDPAEQRGDVAAAAVLEVAPQSTERVDRQGRDGIEPRVLPIVARHNRELEFLNARQTSQLLDAIAPIIEAAEKAHQHEPRPGERAFGVKIDRIGMRQPPQASESEGKWAVAVLGRRGDGAEIAVGKGQDDDVAGRLSQIDRAVGDLERTAVADQQVHD